MTIPKQNYFTLTAVILMTTLVSTVPAWSAGEDTRCETIRCITERNAANHTPTLKPRVKKAAAPVSANKEKTDEATRIAVSILNAKAMEEYAQQTEEVTPAKDGAGLSCATVGGCNKVATGAEIIAKIQKASEIIEAIDKGNGVQAPMCSAFSDGDSLNQWGKLFVKHLHDPTYKQFYNGTPDLLKYCPNLGNTDPATKMTDEQKTGLHLILLSGLANSESSCKPNARLGQARNGRWGAPNGTAAGLIQLHLGKEHLYTPITGGCVKNASLDPEKTIKCYLAMGTERAMRGKNWIERHHFAALDPNDTPRRGKKLSEGRILINNVKSYRYCKVPSNAGIKTAKN